MVKKQSYQINYNYITASTLEQLLKGAQVVCPCPLWWHWLLLVFVKSHLLGTNLWQKWVIPGLLEDSIVPFCYSVIHVLAASNFLWGRGHCSTPHWVWGSQHNGQAAKNVLHYKFESLQSVHSCWGLGHWLRTLLSVCLPNQLWWMWHPPHLERSFICQGFKGGTPSETTRPPQE